MDSNPADLVLSAFKDRGIPARRDEIRLAIQGSEHDANAKWVSEHLKGDTLLSNDELALFSMLEASGELPDIAVNPDIDNTRPLLDEDLQGAIDSLNASTSALEQQTEVLKSQFDTFNKQFLSGNNRSGQNSDLGRLQRKHTSGWQSVNATTSDLTHELDEDLKRETEKTAADGRKILSFLTSRLKEDDRKLASIENLASQIESTGNDFSTMKQASQLSDLLAEYIAAELYHRLDRLYLTAIQTDKLDPDEISADDDEVVAALEADLESLYQEIGVLAQMSTTQQFNKPIHRELHNHCTQKHIISLHTLNSVLEMVTQMTSSTENMAACLQDRQSFCETLKALVTVYQSEISNRPLGPSDRENSRRRSMQPALHSSPEKPTIQTPDLQNLETVFRRFGLSSKSIFQPEEQNRSGLALHEKKLQLQECLTGLDVAADSSLVSMLASTDSANQQLAVALNSDSEFGTTLSNPDLEKRLSALEGRLGFVQRGMENLNLDVLYQRDKAQAQFMDKWGDGS